MLSRYLPGHRELKLLLDFLPNKLYNSVDSTGIQGMRKKPSVESGLSLLVRGEKRL